MFGQSFGIEVEFTGCSYDELYTILLRRPDFIKPWQIWRPELAANRMFSLSTAPDKIFGLKSDLSVSAPGGEFVSFIMNQDDLALYRFVLELLRGLGQLRTDHTCGLHIHVGAPLGEESASREFYRALLWHNWHVVMPRVFRAFRPTPRREQYHCKMDMGLNAMGRTRYLAINDSRTRHPTTEFRLFDSQLDFRYIYRAVRLACGLVAVTREKKVLREVPRHLSVEKYLEEVWTDPKPNEEEANRLVLKIVTKQLECELRRSIGAVIEAAPGVEPGVVPLPVVEDPAVPEEMTIQGGVGNRVDVAVESVPGFRVWSLGGTTTMTSPGPSVTGEAQIRYGGYATGGF